MPFRTSHHVVGDIVKFCEKNDKQLVDLSIDELQAFSKLIDKDIFKRRVGIITNNNFRVLYKLIGFIILAIVILIMLFKI